MVWFQCEDCGDTLKKPKVKGHAGHCSASRFSCVDCLQVFDAWSVQGHTTCVTEHEKYALSITKPGQEHLMSAAAAAGAQGGGGGPISGATQIVGERFLAKGPPWDCSCCNVKCTSQETLQGHAQGKKHKSKSRTKMATMGLQLDGLPLPPPEEKKEEKKDGKRDRDGDEVEKKQKKAKKDKKDKKDKSSKKEKKEKKEKK
jgi:cell growth-regulating nucleolar protein